MTRRKKLKFFTVNPDMLPNLSKKINDFLANLHQKGVVAEDIDIKATDEYILVVWIEKEIREEKSKPIKISIKQPSIS